MGWGSGRQEVSCEKANRAGSWVILSTTTGGGSRRPHSESARNSTRFVCPKLRLYPPVLSVENPRAWALSPSCHLSPPGGFV